MSNGLNRDRALWSAFRTGKKKAFSDLFARHYDHLYFYGIRLENDEAFVKDVLQDFFLYLFENRRHLASEVQNINSYLIVSFRRLLLKRIKARGYRCRVNLQNMEEEHPFAIGIEDIIIRDESRMEEKTFLLNLVNGLSPRQREILYLKYYENLSLPEIAETLSITYQVVANQISRSIKKLKRSRSALKAIRHGIGLLVLLN